MVCFSYPALLSREEEFEALCKSCAAAPPSEGGPQLVSCECRLCKRQLKVHRDGHRDYCPKCESDELLQMRLEKEIRRQGSPPPSLSDRTDAMLRGIRLLMVHHDMPSCLIPRLCEQLGAHLNSAPDEEVWLKRVKFLLAAPLAGYLGCEAPAPPDISFQARGHVRSWLRNRMAVFNRKNTHLWFSWFQTKRCTLECSDDFVEETYKDHLKALTSPDLGDEEQIDRIFSDGTFLRVLAKTRDGIKRKLDRDHWLDRTPSKNACYEYVRGQGGQQAFLRDLSGLFDASVGYPELSKMIIIPHLSGRGGLRHHIQAEVREPFGSGDWKTLESQVPLGRPGAKIQIVLEPLKGRVISKGPAVLYSRCRPLQKAMHKTLRHMPCFKLIGGPFSPTDVCPLRTGYQPGDGWLSIDYKAATDNLSWKYSRRILRYITEGLPFATVAMALECLGPHDLWYPHPDLPGEFYFGGTQTSGQLMGSILSFPVLCLANLGVYLANMSHRQCGWRDYRRLSAVLVNGDDMLYVGSEADYANHTALGASIGLSMSVGKAYWHPVYANINSTSVHCKLSNADSTPWLIPFLNTGLFYGAHKVQRKANSAAPHNGGVVDSLAGNLNLILEGALPGRQAEILSRFLSLHADHIRVETRFYSRKSCFSRNLFLPVSLGGLGILPPPGFKFRITTLQRRLARSYRDKHTLSFEHSRPYPEGYVPDQFSPEADKPWFARDPREREVMRLGGLENTRLLRRGAIRALAGGLRFFTDLSGVMLE